MLNLSVKVREELGKKTKKLREQGIIPAVLYGPKIKTLPLQVASRDFEKIYQEAGESSLISLEVAAGAGPAKKFLVLVHDLKSDALTRKTTHIDFYQPSLEEEVEVTIPLIFEGDSKAVKDLGGTLVKNISHVTVKAKPQNLPHAIKVNVENIKTFEDSILIKDLPLPEGVKILRGVEEIVVLAAPPEKVEEELEKPIEEKVEEVEKVEKKKEAEEKGEEGVEKTEKTEKAKTEKTEKTEKETRR